MNHSFTLTERLLVALLILGGLLARPQPTFAQTHYAGATAVESKALQQSVGIVAVTGTDGARLRATPLGTVSQILPVGQTVTVMGRNAENTWLFVHLPDKTTGETTGETTGWIAANELVVFGIDRLPVVELAGSGSETVDSETGDNDAVDSDAVDSETVNSEAAASNAGDSTITELVTGTATTRGTNQDSTTAVGSTEPLTNPPLLSGAVTLSNSRLNIRSGPATSYAVVGKAQPAETLSLLGRNERGDWVQVQFPVEAPAAAAMGWVASRYLAITGDLLSLPVVDAVSTAPVYQEDSRQSVTDPSTATVNADLAQTATAANQTLAAATTSGSATGLTGTLVFQSSPGGLLYAYRLDTGALWSLTNGFDPAISPDGQTVAFVREGGENGIYLIDIDGGNERLIFSGRTRLSSPKWSPDGQWILFTRSDEYSECVDLGRGGCVDVNRLPPGMPTDNLTLSKEYEYNLAVVDPDGDHYHDIAALESARVADWSKAGIVYQSSAGLQITDDREDAENRLLLFIPLQPPHEDPDWQPNGGKVAFVQHHGSHYEIFTINPDGSGMTALTRPVTTLVDEMPNNLAPAWSPDGHHIVFLSNRAAGNEAGAWRIWVMDADGSNQRALPITITIHYTYGNEQSVDWGPTS